LKSSINRYLVPGMRPKQAKVITYEDQVDFMTHHYDFIYHLDGLVDLA